MKKNRMESGSMRDWMKDKEEAQKLEMANRAGMTRQQLEERLNNLYIRFEEDNKNVEIAKNIAQVCEQLENYDDALNFYKWSYNLSKNDVSIERKINFIEDKITDKYIKQLKQELKNGENLDKNQIKAKQDELDNILKERNEKKIQISEQRVKRNPTDPQLRFELGQAFFSSGEYSKAIPEFQRCKNNPHLHTQTMLLLGRCYTAKNMLDLARDELQRARSELKVMDSTKKEIVYELGLIFEKMKEPESSLNCMKEIYSVDYQYRDVAQRVEGSY